MSTIQKQKPVDATPIPDAAIVSNVEIEGGIVTHSIIPPYFIFQTTIPKCETVEQAKCLLKIRFQHHLDEFFNK